MNESMMISYNELPPVVKERLHNRWYVDLVNRYKAMGFGEPKGYEIERNKNHRIEHTVFIQSGHIFYECTPARI